jgi:hypothetical protein
MDQEKPKIPDASKDKLNELVQQIYVRKGTNAYKTKETESDVALVRYKEVEVIFTAFSDKVKQLSKKMLRWYHIIGFIAIGILIGILAGFYIGYYVV